MGTWADTLLDTKRACDRDNYTRQQHQDARKEAARELIATALFCIDRDCPYAAAAKLEDAIGLLRGAQS